MNRTLVEALSETKLTTRKSRSNEAVKRLGRPCEKWVDLGRDGVHAIIIRLGGLSKAAAYFGTAKCTPVKWRLAGRIPSWAHALYQELTSPSK